MGNSIFERWCFVSADVHFHLEVFRIHSNFLDIDINFFEKHEVTILPAMM